MPRLYLSAAHKSSGKTTVGLGLARALTDRGLVVQPFKKGPDYIDPMWLTQAASPHRGAARADVHAPHRACLNLDPHLMSQESMLRAFAEAGTHADIALVEGNHGLFDGLSLDGRDSNAALARMLDAPVLLVIDARGITRGIAPLLLGYKAFDPALRIGGVVLNRVATPRHEHKLRAVIEHYVDLPVLGSIPEDPQLALQERQLGLIPCFETQHAEAHVQRVAAVIAQCLDLDAVVDLARSAPGGLDAAPPTAATSSHRPGEGLRVGIARDRAFGFYYPDDLSAFESLGATLVPFDALQDARLPDVDALFIGGGFPEMHIEALAGNASMRQSIRSAVEAGLPTYAECAGLMYLSRSLRWRHVQGEMVGVIPADALMHDRPVGRGYVTLRRTSAMPWCTWPASNATVHAHEFHHSTLEGLPQGMRHAWEVVRGHGIDGRHDGLVMHNMLASYTHLRDATGSPWVAHFLNFVQTCKASARALRVAGLAQAT